LVDTTVTDATTSTPLDAAPVELFDRAGTSGAWTQIRSLSTASNGAISANVHPAGNTEYKWTYAGDATHAAASSAVQKITVGQTVTIKLSKSRVAAHKKVHITGAVSPKDDGKAVTLQQRVHGKWSDTGKKATLAKRVSHGTIVSAYTFTLTKAKAGHYTFRNGAGTSPTRTLTVK
jgi:hypothetical protein